MRPGLIDDAGQLRDLSYILQDITPDFLSPDDIDILSAIEPETLPPVTGQPIYETPVAGVGAVYVDGVKREVALSALAPSLPAVVTIAGVVGAPAWVGAYMLGRLYDDGQKLALGPWLVASDRPLRLDRCRQADGRRLAFKHRTLQPAILAAESATVGDLTISLGGPWPDGDIRGLEAFGKPIADGLDDHCRTGCD